MATMTSASPRLAQGVQLLGEFASSGFKDPPSLARRADGQMVQLPPILYALLKRLDGQHELEWVAHDLSREIHRSLSTEDVDFLCRERLRPMGLLAPEGGDVSATPPASNAMLALKMRMAVIPERFSS